MGEIFDAINQFNFTTHIVIAASFFEWVGDAIAWIFKVIVLLIFVGVGGWFGWIYIKKLISGEIVHLSICPHCKQQVEDTATTCHHCHRSFERAQIKPMHVNDLDT